MRRILFSLIMIAATVGIVSASAYALFIDKAEVKGVSFSSGNADLLINGSGGINDADWFADEVYPGWIGGKYFYLTNDSDSNIGLTLTARLESATNDWGILKDKVNVALIEYSNSADALEAINKKDPSYGAGASTGWVSLSDWNNATPKAFGTSIAHKANHFYVFWTQVATTADNTIIDKGTNTNWVINANQAQ